MLDSLATAGKKMQTAQQKKYVAAETWGFRGEKVDHTLILKPLFYRC